MFEEQNKVLEQQRYLLERRMYRLDPAPPKLPAQEYIVRYLTEKEEKYLAWYLHDQEPALNKLAQAACERYAMTEHFADIKQAAVCGILAALKSTLRLSAHRLPLFKSGICRTAWVTISVRRRAVLSP